MRYCVVLLSFCSLISCGGEKALSRDDQKERSISANVDLMPNNASVSVSYTNVDYQGQGTLLHRNELVLGDLTYGDDWHSYELSTEESREVLIAIESNLRVSMTIAVYSDEGDVEGGYLDVNETDFGFYRLTLLPEKRYQVIVSGNLLEGKVSNYRLSVSDVSGAVFGLTGNEYLISEMLSSSNSCGDTEDLSSDTRMYSVLNIKDGYVREPSRLVGTKYLLSSASSAGFVIEQYRHVELFDDLGADYSFVSSYAFNADHSGGIIDATGSVEYMLGNGTRRCELTGSGDFFVEF